MKKALWLICVALLIGAAVPPSLNASLINTDTTTTDGFQDFTSLSAITVSVSGIGAPGAGPGALPLAVSVYDISVSFDPALYTFVSVTFGDPTLGQDFLNLDGNALTFTSPSPGVVEVTEISLDTPEALVAAQPRPNFTLFTVNFSSAIDSNAVTVTPNSIGDAGGNAITPQGIARSANDVDLVLSSETPEPSTLLMLGTGLLALGLGWRATRTAI